MAKSFATLEQQLYKIGNTLGRISPPEPDDQFEDLRRDVLKFFTKMQKHVHDRVVGGEGG
jgi:hypothetical protein